MVLNPALYARLVQRFGKGGVEIVRVGEPYNPNWVFNPVTGKMTRNTITDGEAYKVSCPYCGDRRGRLYINHFWMMWDNESLRNESGLICCFNETRCMDNPDTRTEFFTSLFGTSDPQEVGMTLNDTEKPEEIVPSPPGAIIPLRNLPVTKPICHYLQGRGYNLEALDRWWHIGQVASVVPPHHPDCLNRIYIPMFHDGKLVGYQCRFVGDREWTKEVPKYRTMRGMRKGKHLYNFDNASRSKVVVIVEGPTSAWKVGPRAVAIWGNAISKQQLQLIKSRWGRGCLVVVLLDGKETVAADKLQRLLQLDGEAKVVRVSMGFHEDPGLKTECENWQLIQAATEKCGINLLEYLEGENIVSAK